MTSFMITHGQMC